jgi:CHAT domain-containing protein
MIGGDNRAMIVVADGEIASVPFPALRDTASAAFLVEQHPLRFAAALREAANPGRAPRAATTSALFVADPAFHESSHPELSRLPGARNEVDRIAPDYRNAVVLSGAAATRVAIERAAASARVVHFAGHAVFDEERPERSYMLLAGAPGNDRLSARDLARSASFAADLVVLSACETLHARAGRAGAVSGLAAAILERGAGGVVGSDWRVDDRLTLPLMVELHRAYRATGNGSLALQAAQTSMLKSSDPALRSPAAWAAFRYVGN